MPSTNSFRPSSLWTLLLLGCLAGYPASTPLALSTDQDQPLNIEADSAEIDERKAISIYTGNVEMQQGSTRLWADRVTVYHKQRKAERIIAVGKPARYRQLMDNNKGEVKAKALRMEYLVKSEELYLFDQAVVDQGKDRFASDRITYDRKRELVKGGASAKGKERVRITIDTSDK